MQRPVAIASVRVPATAALFAAAALSSVGCTPAADRSTAGRPAAAPPAQAAHADPEGGFRIEYPLVSVMTAINELDRTVPPARSLPLAADRAADLEIRRGKDGGLRVARLGERPAADAVTGGWVRTIRQGELAALYDAVKQHARLTHIASPLVMAKPGETATFEPDERAKDGARPGLRISAIGSVLPDAAVVTATLRNPDGSEVVTFDGLTIADDHLVAAMLPARAGGPARLIILMPRAIREKKDYPFQTASGFDLPPKR